MYQLLEGVRVLDMSRVLAGPWSSQVLADLGAEVIKVEHPNGDETRSWGPPFLSDPNSKKPDQSAYFLSANRGKKSVVIDFSTASGQKRIKKMIRNADVVIENFKVGTLKKYHLDYDSVSVDNKRLIYCSITGFGQNGSYRNQSGYDFLMQGLSGLMSVTGENKGFPMKSGVAIEDIFTGLYSVIAIQSALIERTRSNKGQYIDMALFDTAFAVLANQASNYSVSGIVPSRIGNSHPNIVPYQVFEVSDGYFILAIGNDSQFSRLCALPVFKPYSLAKKYPTNAIRVSNRNELCSFLQKIFIKNTRDCWLELLQHQNIPCGPINTIAEAFSNPQLHERNMIEKVAHPYGDVYLPSLPINFVGKKKKQSTPPPLLGEHDDEI